MVWQHQDRRHPRWPRQCPQLHHPRFLHTAGPSLSAVLCKQPRSLRRDTCTAGYGILLIILPIQSLPVQAIVGYSWRILAMCLCFGLARSTRRGTIFSLGIRGVCITDPVEAFWGTSCDLILTLLWDGFGIQIWEGCVMFHVLVGSDGYAI